MSNDQNRNDSVSSRFFSLASLIRSTQTREAVPSSSAAPPEAAADDNSMPALSAGLDDSDDEDDATAALQRDLSEPTPTFESIPVVIRPTGGRSRTTTTNGQSLSGSVPTSPSDVQSPIPPVHHEAPQPEHSTLSSSSSSEVAPDGSQGDFTGAPSGAAPDVPLPSTVRDRRVRDDGEGGYESEGSLPSLQTVSDSSDDGWTDEESNEDESDEEDEEDEGRGGEDGPDEDSAFNSLPRLGPNLPPGAARLMQTLTRAVAEAREGWVGMDLENGGDEDGDHFDPISILAGPGADPLSRIIAPPGAANHRSGFILNTMRQVIDALGSPAIPETDPKRAELITKSLEVISEDLVRRYEKLRAGQEGEESEGCAVCRESFLDPTTEEAAVIVQFAELPYPAGDESSDSAAKILAFPCPGMHLFHSHCISPWLERKTTCPTCRFDVDPDSLTLTFLREIRQRSNHPLANNKWSVPHQKSFRRWLEREERKLAGDELSDSDSEEVEEYINGSPVDDADDLPPLVADQFAATNATPDPALSSGSAPQPAPANPQPSRGPPIDVADFYNIDPVVRENMLAALIPIMDMTMDIDPDLEDESESGSEWEDDEDEDEDDDELPPLIPVGRNGPPTPARASAQAALEESDVDDDLPALVDAILAGSVGDTVLHASSTESWYDHDDDDDELPELVPVHPRGAPAQPSATAAEDDDDLPDLVGETPRRPSMEDID
ncbi:RING-type domain-containing protein [Phanerochaete sordida]|uniref:RING-type domain-containing protein n=1 Tax=Phanerochaete sordida TaxID=48140 RepID=A0A9P3G1F6_9APHY|nr:RING-type domain-containing protein [Phanerochaete sordida]